MCNRFSILAIFLILLSIQIKSQEIDEEFKQKILLYLSSDKGSVVWAGVDYTIQFKLYEAIQVLENIIWKQEVPIQLSILWAMAYLNAPNTQQLAIAFIDSVDFYNSSRFFGSENKLSAKAHVNQALFYINDYSQADYVMQQLRVKPYDVESIWLLPNLIRNVPQYENEAKSILINAANNSEDYRIRFNAVHQLEEVYGAEMIPIYINFFKNVEESGKEFSSSRIISFEFLCKYNYDGLENLIKEQIYNEPAAVYKRYFIDTLFNRYGNPENLNYIVNFYNWETDSLAKRFVSHALENFTPKEFPMNITLPEMIDSLKIITNKTFAFQWIDSTTKNLLNYNLDNAKTKILNSDSIFCANYIKQYQDLVNFEFQDTLNTTPEFVTLEGWQFLYYYAQYILDRLPEPQANPNLLVNLKNSFGVQIPAGNVTYYESATSGWKDAVNNGDGTFTVITTKSTVSIRMFYEFANQTVHNVPAQNNTYTFTTVNTAVQLKNSSGNLMPAPSGDQGTVQYYADAWRTFGTTTNGVAYKELLPINYSFRMTYEYIPNDKQQDISTNSTVTFTTVLCTLKVTNANNQPLAGASTKYYSTAWRDIGLTNAEGIITKELLPKNLSFRATYGNVSLDKQQDISVNILVEIQLNVP
ncbi:MAG: hypothetical protein HND39_10600 [Ignavibacteriota bacterium]|jgi:hypothetical protein|nr:MAG: hypothetical protein EDM72_10990 [Chlorobiota bacterium]MBL1122015.1 hypothetical protein [Ignavibacteriota bacterium]MBV6421180.1 hypothetical protein [Ignavibacteriaceae bacterium]MCE7856131.1 hypothetical protein [Ignavibacteria bacterium CHB3]QKJ96695.1 MAG: hypothetical protein HND39_10600 [Ignavibacteriota bacterium]